LSKKLREPFSESPHGVPPTPSVQLDRLRLFRIRVKYTNELLRESPVENAERIFFIELTRSVIEIRCADHGPLAVHDHEFAVNERGLILVDFDARLQQSS
jgi:hypothetical protein